VTTAVDVWASLDDAWQTAFALAWEAVATGNIGVGAVVSDPSGRIVSASRNRVADSTAPAGEVAGSSLAHAEMNALATLRFRSPRELTLTTTLQPCLQCSAAIRMSPVAAIRVAGADPLWDGCHDFTALAPWLGRREAVPIEGPRTDEVAVFGTLISRFGLGLIPAVDEALRAAGQGPINDLAAALETDGRLADLTRGSVADAFAQLWPDLQNLK
jgi:tRNA(Arg) A34 adenosine deaminase TadA